MGSVHRYDPVLAGDEDVTPHPVRFGSLNKKIVSIDPL